MMAITLGDGVTLAPQAPLPRHVTVGAFFDRFGDLKLPLLASTDATVQAFVKDATVRRYIDLDRADLRIAVVAVGADPVTVIDATVRDDERP